MLAAVLTLAVTAMPNDLPKTHLRPPAVPLVLHDPYFSIWSNADAINQAPTRHWTQAEQPLNATATIDGTNYRFLGDQPDSALAMAQVALQVTPTRTVATFQNAAVELRLTFLTPSLPHDLDTLERPITYMLMDWTSRDGKPHTIQTQCSAGGTLATHDPTQTIGWTSASYGSNQCLSFGTTAQPVLERKGDWTRIDWGHALLAAPKSQLTKANHLIAGKPTRKRSAPGQDHAAQLVFNSFEVKSNQVRQWLMLGYDDGFSIEYFGQHLRPYWKRNGMSSGQLIELASQSLDSLERQCEKFDAELTADLTRVGGTHYAELCALAYRQCLAANKIVADPSGNPLLFPKENTSNGCIATVDVIYPMAPQFFLFSPSLSKAMLVPVLDYAASPRWKFPFAPHDLGTYPHANGQVYGGGERTEENQMPVEESANMLLLVAVLAKMEDDTAWIDRYWPVLQKWADYLVAKGFDPENQLCTDDFLGHLAHNVNLSCKAILGIGSFAKLCAMRGDTAAYQKYRQVAEGFAQRWVKEASDPGHFRLTFDKPGTWSQKYNLVWDTLLDLKLFPDSVRSQEMAKYRQHINPWGLPLDSRGPGAKLDWSLWTATLTQDPLDFAALMEPAYRFVHESPTRVGMGDWYDTSTSKHLFMHSRSVVGGVFLRMLYDKPLWKKWSSRDQTRLMPNWSALPSQEQVVAVVPAADTAESEWRYTLQQPPEGWFKPTFSDAAWSAGKGGFGTPETPGAIIGTRWESEAIWLRRNIEFPSNPHGEVYLWVHHDEDAVIYLDGKLIANLEGYSTEYRRGRKAVPISANQRGRPLVLAVHCRQTRGGQYIDVGFVQIKRP